MSFPPSRSHSLADSIDHLSDKPPVVKIVVLRESIKLTLCIPNPNHSVPLHFNIDQCLF